MSKMLEISSFCRGFRTDILRCTLRELCEQSSTNIKTLSAFENGRSTNFSHVMKYIDACNIEQKYIFTNEILRILRG